jgi:glycosyltransferase involved in cell wall biosynthesis
VRDFGLDGRVRFLGERSDVPDLLGAADIFLQANSGPEGLGMVFMEALAARLPVVTMHLGGAPELIDDQCGILAPPGDVAAVADALDRLIQDRALRQQMGDAGRQRVMQQCDPAEHFRKLAEVLSTSAHSGAREALHL